MVFLMREKTFFGLPIVIEGDDHRCVRVSDIRSLPFFEFWEQGARGTTQVISADGEILVYVQDWEAFARLFIKTGRHRLQP